MQGVYFLLMILIIMYMYDSLRRLKMRSCCNSSVQILILADESVEDSAIQADSRSLATLLLIRDIQVICDLI